MPNWWDAPESPPREAAREPSMTAADAAASAFTIAWRDRMTPASIAWLERLRFAIADLRRRPVTSVEVQSVQRLLEEIDWDEFELVRQHLVVISEALDHMRQHGA